MANKQNDGSMATSYLVAYNTISFIGWSYVLLQTLGYIAQNGTDISNLFDRVGYAVIYVQTGAVLEIVHSVLGLVRSHPLTVLTQVYSRLLLVWGILYLFDKPEVRSSYGLVLMIVSWSITECVRYSHYALTLMGIESAVLVYLRYTLFYVLYPTGVAGELLEIWAAMPYAAAVRPSFKAFLILNVINYPPVLFKLYTHMIKQRRKVLGGKDNSVSSAQPKGKVDKKKRL